MGWLDTPFGAIVVAAEDRRLLDQCGFLDANTRARFFAARIGCAALLPLFALAWFNGDPRLALSMIAALVPSIVLFARHGVAARKMKIPFAPFLALGGVVALFAGNAMLDWYLRFI